MEEQRTAVFHIALIIFCLLGIFGSAVVSFAAIGMLPFLRGEPYETGPGAGGSSGSYGGVSGEVPAPLAKAFTEIGNATGVPPAFLAAISYRECGRLWSVDEATLTDWVENETNAQNTNYSRDRKDCGYNNGYNVWGPMQFLYSTWGLRGSGEAPSGSPKSGTLGDQAAQYTRTAPNMIKIKQAVYAAALLLRKSAGHPTVWEKEHIYKAAEAYCGKCTAPECGYDYCEGVWNLYNRFKEKLTRNNFIEIGTFSKFFPKARASSSCPKDVIPKQKGQIANISSFSELFSKMKELDLPFVY